MGLRNRFKVTGLWTLAFALAINLQ